MLRRPQRGALIAVATDRNGDERLRAKLARMLELIAIEEYLERQVIGIERADDRHRGVSRWSRIRWLAHQLGQRDVLLLVDRHDDPCVLMIPSPG